MRWYGKKIKTEHLYLIIAPWVLLCLPTAMLPSLGPVLAYPLLSSRVPGGSVLQENCAMLLLIQTKRTLKTPWLHKKTRFSSGFYLAPWCGIRPVVPWLMWNIYKHKKQKKKKKKVPGLQKAVIPWGNIKTQKQSWCSRIATRLPPVRSETYVA